MFIVVRYGMKKEALFNIGCKLENLIPFIKKKCDCKDIEIELIDINGHVKEINQNLSVYAQKLFKHREILFLFKVDRTNTVSQYVPLFDDHTVLTADFLLKVASYSNDEANQKNQQQVNKTSLNSSVHKLNMKNTRHSISNTSHHSNTNSMSKSKNSIK